MNDSPSDRRARLMAETLHENWTDGPPAEFARRAAAHARRRRTARKAALTITGTLALAALVAIFSDQRFTLSTSPTPIVSTVPTLAPTPATPAAAMRSSPAAVSASSTSVAKITPAYEIISDIEFEALMRDRPVLILPQQDGTQKIVVLAH